MRVLLLALCAMATPVHAQLINPPIVADVRSGQVTLDSSGNATWDFTAGGVQPPFAGIPDVVHMPKAVDAANPLICNYSSITTSSATIHCWRTNLLGLLTALFGGTVTGSTVNLVARYKAP